MTFEILLFAIGIEEVEEDELTNEFLPLLDRKDELFDKEVISCLKFVFKIEKEFD